ncbi:serine/threonine-protein phosphatase 2A activator-like [Patiria miniata]|uniref:Serine/threonine-protein phosphatase 2A activator n=1 Tax=Patiria miniata TaxID=46514 RepID=A0A913Z591_PATMI|nr:serine/threonine-protein phosphatase 2A activator-like [Patiria miniata]XP_038046920.1 serine/threonine-protein phosphatase 2A activator-like [Patiria miniata]
MSSPNSETALEAGAETSHQYIDPIKRIKSVEHVAAWEKSQAYQDFMGFIMLVNTSVKGKKITECTTSSEICKKLIEMLDTLNTWMDEMPPTDQPQRYGNKAYRDWHKKLCESSESLIQAVVPEEQHPAVRELKGYLNDGFGNATRIDYGSGHEMNYAAFLCCLYKLRVLTEAESMEVALGVFKRYLEVTRRLQTWYHMEPAGSHGVWGLDDFQFIPYIWGSAQLTTHAPLLPKDFSEQKMAVEHSKEYMFMECIRYIHECKTGPFFEHSPTLWGMTSVPYWEKINTGLVKMYKAEVLQKFPIVQHFLFGTVLSFEKAT